ncbi:hypothetical protein AC579_1787 [Pseudocercospora musae]|uniref:Uncharacterized protein n=1 Tax=Pseudocercospora musae TaxID=113226 RepID=A0A139INS1_9PEZI|nr:hypothetical protein AC579_1787 [Pseudocercospora musae]
MTTMKWSFVQQGCEVEYGQAIDTHTLSPHDRSSKISVAKARDTIAVCSHTSIRHFAPIARTRIVTNVDWTDGYLFGKCHKEGRQVVDARAYIKSKTPKVGDYPARVPDFNAPGFANEDERKRLRGVAAAALAMMGEGEEEGKNAEGGAKEMSFRRKSTWYVAD